MLFLTATDQSFELIVSGDADFAATTNWVDVTSASLPAEGSTQVVDSVGGTYTLAAAPAASTNRVVKSIAIENIDATTPTTVTVRKLVGASGYAQRVATLQPGQGLHYEDGAGWYVRSAVEQPVQTPTLSVLMPPHFATANLTSTKTITSLSTFAIYVGKAPKDLSSLQLRFRVTTAAATITWAEVAVARGVVNPGGNPTLTVVGWADVAAVINSTGQKTVAVSVASGQNLRAGEDIWALIGNSATTAAIVRAQSIADDIQAGLQASLATRPSLNVGVSQAYTIESATALGAWVAVLA